MKMSYLIFVATYFIFNHPMLNAGIIIYSKIIYKNPIDHSKDYKKDELDTIDCYKTSTILNKYLYKILPPNLVIDKSYPYYLCDTIYDPYIYSNTGKKSLISVHCFEYNDKGFLINDYYHPYYKYSPEIYNFHYYYDEFNRIVCIENINAVIDYNLVKIEYDISGFIKQINIYFGLWDELESIQLEYKYIN